MSSTSTASTSLKRTHSTINGSPENPMDVDDLPPLPRISGERLLQVFTHKTLRPHDTLSEDFNNERLTELGERVFETAVTAVLFNIRPVLKSQDMLEMRNSFLSDSNFDRWATSYKLREKIRCTEEVVHQLNTPDETKMVFLAYIGGIYTEVGLEPIQEWANQVLGGSTGTGISSGSDRRVSQSQPPEPSGPPPYFPTPPRSLPHAPKRIKSEQPDPQPIFFAQGPSTPLRSTPTPQHSMMATTSQHMIMGNFQPQPQTQAFPAFQSYGNPLAPAQPSMAFLPLFNQTAAQRRVTVEYPAEFAGPSHAGRWTVQCVVNGIPKGVGTGGSKQVAKEEAARQAYYAMGWT
ncbi:hypothetical protein K435DRAFT_960795 [Dendrothele bispora CBS 962.96]|uniref:Uncharacterized protein n=1 Tax=Dendrothele bispora (strain CBS 962.96) TaxID=1314807 RepID=A0A4S8MUC3_DENBC|nr:hypothetical protein K435DRAFT_960795 [Dendrothele bispora CBS 962.96]